MLSSSTQNCIEPIAKLIRYTTTDDPNAVVLDFFAGSGTTGEAVMRLNSQDNGNRRYILVQLPEPLDPKDKQQKVAAKYCEDIGKPLNIAELTKERLRKAGGSIKSEKPDTTAVFRDSAFENDVAKSNLAAILEQHGVKHVRSL